MSEKMDNFAVWFSKIIFTWQSVVTHIVIYTTAWFAEGDDHHLFLDIISMEAVFMTLLVGMATRRAEEQRESLAVLDRQRDQIDLETDQNTNQLISLQAKELRELHQVAQEIHNLSTEVRNHIKDDIRHNDPQP
jgi:uncharacterized membrane protein